MSEEMEVSLMFQAIAADLQIASQDEGETISLLARAGCTPEETRWMSAL